MQKKEKSVEFKKGRRRIKMKNFWLIWSMSIVIFVSAWFVLYQKKDELVMKEKQQEEIKQWILKNNEQKEKKENKYNENNERKDKEQKKIENKFLKMKQIQYKEIEKTTQKEANKEEKMVVKSIEVTKYIGEEKKLIIPTIMREDGVVYKIESIAMNAFKEKGIQSVRFAKNDRKSNEKIIINKEAFANNEITEVKGLQYVSKIAEGGFKNNQLTTLTLYKDIELEKGAFAENNIKELQTNLKDEKLQDAFEKYTDIQKTVTKERGKEELRLKEKKNEDELMVMEEKEEKE